MSKYLRPRTFAMILLVLILAAAIYGFAAANTMPGGTSAGYGEEAITGYTISSVQYRLQASNPRYIDQVTFTIAPTGVSSVYVGLVNGGTMYSCSEAGGTVTCTIPATTVTALSANLLQVSATD
jgi:hypothetical protein